MSKQRFRHELKYKVSLEDAARFFEAALPYCDYDPHAGPTKSYEIASTYYDTSSLQFYDDREESVGYRRKVRLRSYNSDSKCTALFIEIKEKHKQFVSKKRINLRDKTLIDRWEFHNQIPLAAVIDELEDTAEAREIGYLHKRLNLYPVAIIRYIRKALIPKFEHDMRITLDTRITAGGDRLELYDEKKEKLLIDADYGVLEIKSNQSIPLWLHGVLGDFEFVQTRYSKYCLGVDAVFGPNSKWLPSSQLESSKPVGPEKVDLASGF